MPTVQIKDYCFAYQPILTRDGDIVALELLYRDPDTDAAIITDHTAATANVMVNCMNHIGMIQLMGEMKLFINIAADMLMSNVIDLMPKDKVTLELLENIQVTPEIVARVNELKAAGYEFALDDYVYREPPCPLFGLVNIIKIDILQSDLETLPQLVAHLRQWPCKLLAEKVETREVYERCKAAGFDLFQGYYFARPTRLDGRRADPKKLALLNLISLVENDADFDEIETCVKSNPGLTYHLLRLINSPAYYPSTKIGSVGQALQMLGMRQLGRLLQVLLFIESSNADCAPLLELAVHRAKLMELLAESTATHPDRAYVTGMFSLAETALGMPIDAILAELNLVEEVVQALLHGTGEIGIMLEICIQLENADFERVAALADELKIPIPALMEMQNAAILWANQQMHSVFSEGQA
jgi:EAL and modified HD-GYP domain-containing signal transduction protein